MLTTIETIAALRHTLAPWRTQSLAFVPTMGNLHAGHLALVQEARVRAKRVVVSLFVNPTQFGPTEDYAAYPRTRERDLALLTEAGADLVFVPSVEEIYPHGQAQTNRTRVTVSGLNDLLCGATRPLHFDGVATVVTLLLNIVQPHLALFGEKDFQQCLVVRRLVADLCMPVEIVTCPTVREADGLAMSSRNGYLSAEERYRAPVLYRTLRAIQADLAMGNTDYTHLEDRGSRVLLAAGLQPEYCVIRRAIDLTTPQPGDRPLVVLAAVRLGRTRLIDNVQVLL